VRGRVLGATLVGIAFVAPSFLMVLILSALYLKFGGLAWMQALFYGIGAAVIAIIAWSAARLARTTLGRDRLLWGLFAVSLIVTAWTAREIIWVFVASGLIPLLARARPAMPTKTLLVAAWPAWLTSGLTGAASVGGSGNYSRTPPPQDCSCSAAASPSFRSSTGASSNNSVGSRSASSWMRSPFR